MLSFFSSIVYINNFNQGSLFVKKQKIKKEVKILLLGLDNAGKTTILKAISGDNIKKVEPTKGFNARVHEKDCIKFTFWDLGGQQSIRHIWEKYYEGNDAIVYVIDSSDTYRLEETGGELQSILEQAHLSGLPLLIFANKQDFSLSLSAEEVMDALNLNDIKDRRWTIVACSATTKMGLQDGLEWLGQNIK